MRWVRLKSIQVDAIEAVYAGGSDFIISATTGGGKTEAAFLPIISKLVDSTEHSVEALYVSPLKALINDQFRRLEELCQLTDIPVHKWHGDVTPSAKKRLLLSPSGILLTTPESLESHFINHQEYLRMLFPKLKYIVIDELHAFYGAERGAHLRSLVSRLQRYSSYKPRIIALSATLGDMRTAKYWVNGINPDAVKIILGSDTKESHIGVKAYLPNPDETPSCETGTDIIVTSEDTRLIDDIIRIFAGNTALVFANSKRDLERYTDQLNARMKELGKISPFRIHHGSLSKAERESTEESLRSPKPVVTLCSGTLELGIDVGNVKLIGQIGVPWSVTSLRQKLGRSGRRDEEPSILRLLIIENDDIYLSIIHHLRLDLLKTVAMVELMIEPWCEPPETDKWHLSTFIHQVMSLIAETGGATASYLYDRLVRSGAFDNLNKEIFLRVLRDMGSEDLINQIADGSLILGLKGERIVRNYNFYAAFNGRYEIPVYEGSKQIGMISGLPGNGAARSLILAGKRWKITEVAHNKITVEPSSSGQLPYFHGTPYIAVHPRIHSKMRELLENDILPNYLDEKSKTMLKDARSFARSRKILESPFLTHKDKIFWFTWCGSKVNTTLLGMGLLKGLNVEDEDIALAFNNSSLKDIKRRYLSFLEEPCELLQVAAKFPLQAVEKFDCFLGDELRAEMFAHNYLDIPGAMKVIETLENGDEPE